jgi:hypothetical protein
MIDMLDKYLKGVMTVVNWQAQNLCDVLSTELQAIQHNLEATHQEFETHLPAVETFIGRSIVEVIIVVESNIVSLVVVPSCFVATVILSSWHHHCFTALSFHRQWYNFC